MPNTPPPRIGAIRWDAWVSAREAPGVAVEKALGPARYQHRAPFFTHVRGDDNIVIDGLSDRVMDQEIEYARKAGLDHWAFVTYHPPSALSAALELYLRRATSALKFCLITEAPRWSTPGFLDRVVRLTADERYVRTSDGRPLLYLGFLEDKYMNEKWGGRAGMRAEIDRVRKWIEKSARANPFIALMEFNPTRAGELVRELGLDAISSYANGGDGQVAAPYSALTAKTEAFWNDAAATGSKVIPTIMTGWDRRPRMERPMPWETWQKPVANPDRFFQPPSDAELQAHVAHTIQWMKSNDAASHGFAIAYAWNEHDEGGWICPTWKPDGSADAGRIEAFRRAIKPG